MSSASASPAQPTRRTVLRASVAAGGAAAVLGTAGCRLRVGSPEGSPPRPTVPSSVDDLALGRAAGRAEQLAGLYAEATAARPDLARALAGLATDVRTHVSVLRSVVPGTALPATSSPSTSSPSTSLPSTAAPSPSGRLSATTALSALGQAERAAISAALTDVASTSGRAARLLASVAGSGSSHLTLLARLPATPPGPASKHTPKKAG